MSAGTATPTPIASTKYMLANLLQRERIEVKEFCETRATDIFLAGLASPAAAKELCEPRIRRRGTIANGKLDGTALASYWNLDVSPKTKEHKL